MSIATKNTITNYLVKMNNFDNNLNLNDNNNNNNFLLNNKIKLNNNNKMVNSNNFGEFGSENQNPCDFLYKNQQIPSTATGVKKLPMVAVPAKVRNNVSTMKKVLVIYTGGTIGMLRSPDSEGLVPIPHMLEKTVRSFPNFHDDVFAKSQFGNFAEDEQLLVLPKTDNESKHVAYKIMEYDPLLDSSNMTIEDWIHIAKDIQANYDEYDGFVILHGTDTMAYTASALSFMLENLTKSVVVTGSQIPLFESRSDGKENFLGALILAGQYVIPEVSLYFGHKLFRGNRTTKVSSDRLNAFDSPNLSPLATLGINIEVDRNNVLPSTKLPFQLTTSLNQNVALLRLYPSITAQTVKAFLQDPIAGVVLQTYGAGNFPTNRLDLLKELEDASRRGVIIINCTQCGHGTVAAIYETGVKTESAGVIPGFDMTCEAALTKLSYVLGHKDWTLEKKREMMKVCLRGELTSPLQKISPLSSKDFIMEIEDDSDGDENEGLVQIQIQNQRNFIPTVSNSNSNSNQRSSPVIQRNSNSSPVTTVLNNGRVIYDHQRHPLELNLNDLASLLGQNSRNPMWQIVAIIFASQLLLLFCLAVVL